MAPASSTPSRRGRYLLGAVVLLGVVLTAVLVPLSKQRNNKASTPSVSAGGITDAGDKVSYHDVMSALLVGNKNEPVATAPKPVEVVAVPAPIKNTTTTETTFDGADAAVPAGGLVSKAITKTWAAVGMEAGGSQVCYPKDGKEVVTMVSDHKCMVIVLTNSGRKPYDITQTMNISTTKIIIGNPIDLPKLNATGKTIHRLFDVLPGGRLDIRAVRLYRAPPQKFQGGTLRVFAGSTIRVQLGGGLICTACIFLLQPQTIQSFLNDFDTTLPADRVRILGGHVLVLGGNVQMIGSQVFRWQPLGSPVVNVVQIGRDLCVVGGNSLLIGYFDLVGTALLSAVNVGNMVAVLGGTSVLVGAGNINAAILNMQVGAGQNLFVGAGVLITVGYQNIGIFMGLLRCGFATQAVGTGVLVHVGHIHVRAWGVSGVFNAGQTHSVGAGILEKLGGTLITGNINFIFAGAGGNSFVGSGELYWMGVVSTRTLLTSTQFGVAGIYFNGAGYTNLIGCPSVSVNMVRSQFLLGGEVFLGAGIVNFINFKRFNAQLVNAFFGLGSSTFIGAGAMNLVNSFALTRRRIGFARPVASKQGAIWIGGRPISGPVNNFNQLLTNNASGTKIYGNNTAFFRARDKWLAKLGRPNTRPAAGPINKTARAIEKNNRARSLQDTEGTANFASAVGQAFPNAFSKSSVLAINSAFDKVTMGPQSGGASDVMTEFNPKLFATNLGSGKTSEMNKLASGFQGAIVDFWSSTKATGLWDEMKIISDVAVEDAENPGMLSIPAGTECFLCSVYPGTTADHVSTDPDRPNGVGTCRTADDCKAESGPGASSLTTALETATAASAPYPLPAAADQMALMAAGLGGLTEGEPTEEPMVLPDANVIWHEMNIYCPGAGSEAAAAKALAGEELEDVCVDNELLKAIIKEFFMPATGFGVAVANTNVHPAVSDVVDTDLRAAMGAILNAEPGCESGTKYNVYFTSHDPEQVKALEEMWDALIDDPSDLLGYVKKVQAEVPEATPTLGNACAMTIKRVSTATYPPLDRMPAFGTEGLGLVGPSVVVGDGKSLTPITEVVAGEDYTLFLQNLPAQIPYEIQLIHGLDQSGPVVAESDGFTPGTNGVSEITWTPSAEDGGKDGRYYLKASMKNMPLFAFSQPFHIVEAATGRRL